MKIVHMNENIFFLFDIPNKKIESLLSALEFKKDQNT